MPVHFLKDKPKLVFFISYTLLYLLFVQVAGFVLPFFIALVIAMVLKPLYDFLRSYFKFKSSFAATVLTLLIFAVFLFVVGFLLFLVISQALAFYDENRELISKYITSPQLLTDIRDNLMSGQLLNTASDVLQALFQVVPMALTFVTVTFALSVFFLHHIENIKNRLLKRAGEEFSPLLSRVFHTANSLLHKFLRSYLALYVITFAESVFIFCLVRVPYPLAFAFIAAVADILPILGPSTVYLPIAAYFVLQKNFLSAITLAVFLLITVIVRQILEPKLVSDNVKLHPLVVLSAIYFSIVSMNIWVMFYVLSIFLVYRILESSGFFSLTDVR